MRSATLLLRLLAAASLAAPPQIALAQGWYMVELVIFHNTDPSALTAETWRLDPGLPDTTGAVTLDAGVVESVGPSAYRLAGAWQALRSSGQYRPLRHVAWRQPGTSAERAPLVLLGEGPGANVFGTVRVSRGRFLHLELDLVMRDGDAAYRITNRRKMKSNELHYIDHPVIGVLARITPY